MKKILFTFGLLLIFTLLGIWGYLLLFGTPKSVNEVFVDLGLKNPTIERPEYLVPDATVGESDTVAIGGQPLSQLTTRKVAGYIHLSGPASDTVRYAERGTGHVYEINFKTNTETRLLGKTIAKVSEAYFSPLGDALIVLAENGNGQSTTFSTIPVPTDGEPISLSLSGNLRNINLLSSTTWQYTKVINDKNVAYSYNRESGVESELWRIPLTDISVWWGGNTTYIINRPAPFLKGAIYQVTGQGLKPLTEQRYAYVALVNPENSKELLETYYDFTTEALQSVLTNLTTNTSLNLATPALREKCAFDPKNTDVLWCGAMAPGDGAERRTFIREWYSGQVTSNDYLWAINTNTRVSTVMINFLDEAGFVVDIIDPKFSQTGEKLFFINKLNDTLWLYRSPSDS